MVAEAKKATATIPIVFATASDPVGSGLVASLGRPGGNATGSSLQQAEAATKRFELLRAIVPGLRKLAILVNIGSPAAVAVADRITAAGDPQAATAAFVRAAWTRAADAATALFWSDGSSSKRMSPARTTLPSWIETFTTRPVTLAPTFATTCGTT